MNRNVWYWVVMFATLILIMTYNALMAPKFKISRLKALIITFFLFVYLWSATYLAAFVEEGFQAPGTTNVVRAWHYVPLYFIACALIFRIDFRRLSDAMTSCLIIGFATGHIGCAITGCCHGFPYDGFGAIYNEGTQCTLFPIQLVESGAAFILFLAFFIYIVKSKFRITGRQYPVMLIAYMGRFVFEFFRDNEKLWGNISGLSLYSLFSGIVGIVWLFFTTAKGKQVAERIRNAFRRLFKKDTVPVLSVEEYKQQITAMQERLTHPQEVSIPDGEPMLLQQMTKNEMEKKTGKTKVYLIATLLVSALVFVLCMLYLILFHSVRMAIILVSLFTAFSLFLIVYTSVLLVSFSKQLKAATISTTVPIFLRKPDEDITWMLFRRKVYNIHYNVCPECNKKLHFSKIENKQIILVCKGKEKHTQKVSTESLVTRK